jgi:hypothetical protein
LEGDQELEESMEIVLQTETVIHHVRMMIIVMMMRLFQDLWVQNVEDKEGTVSE